MTDGLDPQAKATWLRMLEAAHERAGRRHTVLITHSPEVQEMVPVRVEVGELAREGVTA